MLQHNLTIALRNLWKYKLQTTISVLSIAIGIVTLAVVHGILEQHFRPSLLSTMPYYDRACQMSFDYINPEAGRCRINSEAVRALTENGGLRCAEMGPTAPNGMSGLSMDAVYTLSDTLVRKFNTEMALIEPLYPHYAGYRSALTGQRIAPLRQGEAVISLSLAKIIFGNVNPVGAAVQGLHNNKLSHTIVDVYCDASLLDGPPDPSLLLYAMNDVTGFDFEYHHAPWLNVVLKPECTTQQLEEEANARLEPLGLKVTVNLVKEKKADDVQLFAMMRTLIYFFGSLILLAAGIGFLRMQVQLFWMRKREVSLRIVNGAKRWQLFALLMTEVALVVCCAVALAMLLGGWLEQFVNTWMRSVLHKDALVVFQNIPQYGAVIGALLLLLCAFIVWLTLYRICRSAQGLAAGMRGSRSHTFRNVMLGVQVFIAILFMCATFTLTQICNNEVAQWLMPDDETPYKESLVVEADVAEDMAGLYAELEKLPDAAQIYPYSSAFCRFDEVADNDSLVQLYKGTHYNSYMVRDTAFLHYYQVQVTWHEPALKLGRCILINEAVYPDLERTGALANGSLTAYGTTYPVAGTFRDILFSVGEKNHSSRYTFIGIDPDEQFSSWIMVPKAGRYDELLRSVNSTIARVEPTVVNRMVFNLYENQAYMIDMMRNLRMGAWVLGGVALLVCVMGIYSAIALDTRARRKEMAIRKINGAKRWDIARIFARLYVLLFAVALALIVPLAVLVQTLLGQMQEAEFRELSLLVPVLAGSLSVSFAIALIVGWHVHGIMRVNPADIIAKE